MRKKYDVALRAHHIWLFYTLHFLDREAAIRKNMLKGGYSKQDINRTIRILKKVAKPGVKVKVLADMDDICKQCSVKKKKGCKKGTSLTDLIAGSQFNIWPGETYSSEEILEILGEIHKGTKKNLNGVCNDINYFAVFVFWEFLIDKILGLW